MSGSHDMRHVGDVSGSHDVGGGVSGSHDVGDVSNWCMCQVAMMGEECQQVR